MKVDLSCPIELWSFVLPTAERPACSFTFFNLDRKVISSIQITVTCFDAQDEMISRNVERPMALLANGRDTFMVQVPSSVKGIDSIDLSIDKVWFADGTEWRRAQEARLAEYEPNELPPNRKLEQLRFVAGHDAVGFPSDQQSLWICVCGRVNAADERECRRCMREKDVVFSRFTPEGVTEAITRREKLLEEKARLAREEASKKEFLRQEKARRIKRRKRLRTAFISAALVFIGASYLFVVLGLPEYSYQTALAAMNTGEYVKAKSTFQRISEYRDADDQAKLCDLRFAKAEMLSGNEARINFSIGLLQNLGAYPGADELIDEANYHKGELLLNQERYEEASELFAGLQGFSDAGELRKRAEYMIAEGDLAAGQYDAAMERYASIGNYLDAGAKEKLCMYQKAMELMDGNQFDEASGLFQVILGFRDANEQYKRSIYNSAMTALNDGDYEKAIEKFILLGRYEDAGEQHKYSVYKLAGQKQEAEDYLAAMRLYLTIPDYEQSNENAVLCAYTLGSDLANNGKYDEAIEYLEIAGDYKDAGELRKQCYLTPAEAAIDEENYPRAIELLRAIQSETGVEKRFQEVCYRYAEQLETSGEYELAAEMFASLGDYEDAKNRILGIEYAKAEKLLAEKEYEAAGSAFESLGEYRDAPARLQECQLQPILDGYDENSWQDTYAALMEMKDFALAQEKALEIAYMAGDRLFKEAQINGANEALTADEVFDLYEISWKAFELAGEYEDTIEKTKECVYDLAVLLMKREDFMEAAMTFDFIISYKDAWGLRDECIFIWLDDMAKHTDELYDSGDYAGVIEYLSDIEIENIPDMYRSLRTRYYESNVRIARDLITKDRALEAYPYLLAAKPYAKAKEMLKKNIYTILGTWEITTGERVGVRYAFYLNGTCSIAGEEYLFNMPGAYPIMIGKTENDMTRMFSFSGGSENSIRLRDESTGKTISLTRVKQAELSPTEDEEGMMSVEVISGGPEGATEETAPENLEETMEGELSGDELSNETGE